MPFESNPKRIRTSLLVRNLCQSQQKLFFTMNSYLMHRNPYRRKYDEVMNEIKQISIEYDTLNVEEIVLCVVVLPRKFNYQIDPDYIEFQQENDKKFWLFDICVKCGDYITTSQHIRGFHMKMRNHFGCCCNCLH